MHFKSLHFHFIYGNLGNAVSFDSGIWGGAPGRNQFWCILVLESTCIGL